MPDSKFSSSKSFLKLIKSSNKSLTPAQIKAVDRLFEYDHTILVAGTGVGKTIIALSAISELLAERILQRVIVACPAKVLETEVWPNEITKWSHLTNVSITQLKGTAEQRSKLLRTSKANILVVSLNNLDWLLQQHHSANGIIIDELSKAAGKQTAGLKSKKKSGSFIWRVGMTATPVSQNFEKLYGMARIIDGGKSLGTNRQKFLQEYFYPDYMGYNWTLKGFADAKIMEKVASLVYLMDNNKVKVLPAKRESLLRFAMPEKTRLEYDAMRKHLVAGDIEAANEAVKSGKLRQIASGFMYDGKRTVHLDHARLDCAREWWTRLNGRSGLIFYEFIEQLEQLRIAPSNIRVAQINSMSHGIDGLQDEFADVLFYQPVWSRDAAEQAVGRVWRQGQKQDVTVSTLICTNTLDDLVIARVEDRAMWMKIFTQHLKG